MSDQIEEAKALLKAHGFKLSIGGCGCCDSPWVRLSHNGRDIIFDASGDVDAHGVRSVDQVNFDMFEDAPPA